MGREPTPAQRPLYGFDSQIFVLNLTKAVFATSCRKKIRRGTCIAEVWYILKCKSTCIIAYLREIFHAVCDNSVADCTVESWNQWTPVKEGILEQKKMSVNPLPNNWYWKYVVLFQFCNIKFKRFHKVPDAKKLYYFYTKRLKRIGISRKSTMKIYMRIEMLTDKTYKDLKLFPIWAKMSL